MTGMNIWQGVRFIEKFNSQEELWLDMINSLQVRIRILSKEVGYLFWVWMKLVKSHERQLFLVILTPCLCTPVGRAWLTGENSNFKKIFGVRPGSKFLTGEITKLAGDNMKILRGEPHKHTVINKKHTHISPYIYIYALKVWKKLKYNFLINKCFGSWFFAHIFCNFYMTYKAYKVYIYIRLYIPGWPKKRSVSKSSETFH